jgi:subtilisin family serine protease
VFVTLSAGNTGADLSFAHGAYNALVVGASFVTSKQPYVFPGFVTSAVGPLSSGRTYPHVLAVGEALTCAALDNEAGSIDSYGTSGAAALVAGTAALVRQVAPDLTALEVKALLLNTSEAVALGNPNAAGYGYLRSDRAAQAALDGEVVQGVVATGQVKSHPLALAAGEQVAGATRSEASSTGRPAWSTTSSRSGSPRPWTASTRCR